MADGTEAALATEADAENVLLGAVMDADVQDLGESGKPEIAAPSEADLDDAETAEADADAEAKDDGESDGEDFVEIPPEEEGGEPTRVALKDVLEGYRQFQALGAERTRAVETAQAEVYEQARSMLTAQKQGMEHVGRHLQAVLQLIKPPPPPDPNELRNPNSPLYGNTEEFLFRQAQHGQVMRQFEQIKEQARALMEGAEAADTQMREMTEERELRRLEPHWPQFKDDGVRKQFVSDMAKHYGYSEAELDASLNDYRNALVARDALAYRAMKAQSKDVKAKVEKAAPKIVRTKQEAKGGAQARDPKGQFVKGTYARAMQSQSDDDWANHFAALAKQGRI